MHAAHLLADLFDEVVGVLLAECLQAGRACEVFLYPGAGKGAVLDVFEDTAHVVAGVFVDDARTAKVVAELGGVADRVVHEVDAALVEQVGDEFDFLQAAVVGDLGLIASFDKSLEGGTDQGGETSTKDDLFREEVGLGLFGDTGVHHTDAGAAKGARVGQGDSFGLSGEVLLDGPEGRDATAVDVHLTQHGAWSVRGDHGHVDVAGWVDLPILQAEAVSDHQHVARLQVGTDILGVDPTSMLIGYE